MTALRPLHILSFAFIGLAPVIGLRAQCTNTSPYPSNSVVPEVSGSVTTITDCNWQTEYATITGVMAGSSYEFAMEDGAWITVHQGMYNGPVLGFGDSPLMVLAPTSQNIYVHWNTDSLCGVEQMCHATTVQLLGVDCTQPEVSTEVVPDCDNGQFFVQVVVVNTGDATSVGLSWSVNGGASSNLGGLQAGTYLLGPFANSSLIDLTVVHAEQAACNVVVNDITNDPCLSQSCGPDTYTFCYGNNENYVQTYQGDSNFPLRLQFNSGNVSPSGNDALVIHDGLLPTDPVLFSGVGNGGNLTGVIVVSTNPDHALTLTFTSNASFSCGDGSVTPPWNYTVGCLDCSLPAGSVGEVITDCAAQEFTVEVTVDDMGSATSVEIANSAGVPATAITATGSYTVGPFPIGTPVQLSLVNLQSTICTLQLGTFENAFCPVLVVCGGPGIADTYCYLDSDHHSWLYQNTGTEPLAIFFSAGSIESATYDHLTIYDGTDNTADVLYDHVQGSTEFLAGLTVVSTGTSLFMEMSSDPSVSCESGSQQQWAWSLGCLDCTNPTATFEVVPDCIHHEYSVAVSVSDLGSAPEVRIANSLSSDTLSGVGLGTAMVGPFPVDQPVQVTVLNSLNTLCRINGPSLAWSADSCVTTACANLSVEYCYTNSDTAWFVYQSGIGEPVTISFSDGQMLANDNIRLYNGLDTMAQLVYVGNQGGQPGGLALSSSNSDNAITMLITSNGTGSCATGEASPQLHWNVGCGLVGEDETFPDGFTLFPNPTINEVFLRLSRGCAGPAVLEVVDVMGRSLMVQRFTAKSGVPHRLELGHLGGGSYAVRLSTPAGAWTERVYLAR